MSSPPYVYLLIVAVSFICYWNSLGCDLVHDDIFAIKKNQDLRSDTPWLSLFKNDFWGKPMSDNTSHKSYRPLTVATFRLNYSFHALSPFGYHFVNALLHTVVSIVFLNFCKKNVFNDQKTSIFTAVLFAVHPIHTEAVTGVVGRADILACLTFLISLQLYSRGLAVDDNSVLINNNLVSKQASSSSLHTNMPLVAVVALSSVGMLCKEQGITVIGVCIFLEIARRREDLKNFILKKLEFCDIERSTRALLRITILIVSAMFLMVCRLYLMKGQLPAFNEEDNPASFARSITTRFMTYCYLCAFNLQLLLLPSCLSYDWQVGSIPLVESFADIRNLQTVVTFSVLAALSVRALAVETHPKKSENVLLLALALMVIPFLPASNLFFRVGFVVAERILYIPSLGYCILIGHGFRIIMSQLDEDTIAHKYKAVNGSSLKKETKPKGFGNSSYTYVLWASSVVFLSTLMLRTIDRNTVWKNRESLFRSGIEVLPHNAKAHYNYANLMKDTGKTDDAIQHYRTAIRLYPKYASSHNNLATLLGMSEEAEYHLKQTLVHNPYHYKAMYNLASLYKQNHRKAEAKILLERCLSIEPNYYEAVQIFAEVLHDLGETQRAIRVYYNASLSCNDAKFFNNYGYFLGNIGKGELSLRAYERAIAINPKRWVSLVNYGRQLKVMEQYQEAELAYRRALAIKRDPNTLHLLAVLLYQTERLKECELVFSEALKYEPRNEDYIRNHAIAVFEQDRKDDAIYLLREALKVLPNSSSTVKLLVNFLMNISKPNEALGAVSIGLGSNPKDFELHHMRANAHRALKNFELALESYKEVVELNPKHFSALQNIGVIYHIQGRNIEAKHFYDKALKIEPNNTLLKDNIAKLVRTMQKRSGKAASKSSANMA